MADKRLSNIPGWWRSAGPVMGGSVFLHLAGGLLCRKFGKCGSKEMGAAFCRACAPAWHAAAIFGEGRTSYCLIVLSHHHRQQQRPRKPLRLPHHSDSWKQNSSDLFCCHPPPPPPLLSLTPNCPIPPHSQSPTRHRPAHPAPLSPPSLS